MGKRRGGDTSPPRHSNTTTIMKFKATASFLYNGGTHAEEGDTIDVSEREAANLYGAGRGYPVKDEPEPAPEKPDKKAK